MDMARPRSHTGMRRVRSAWRESITPMEPTPNAKWPNPSTRTCPTRAMVAEATTIRDSDPVATRAGPQRSVERPTSHAPAAAPAPPAPTTTLVATYPYPPPSSQMGRATSKMLIPRLAAIHGA